MTIELRSYQEEAVGAVIASQQRSRRILLSMATGTGKTEVFLSVLDRALYEGTLSRALIIAHTDELIEQIFDRIAKNFPKLNAQGVGVVKSKDNDCSKAITVATVQTLSRPGRLSQWLDGYEDPPSHIIVDEAHHAVASTYRSVIDQVMEVFTDCQLLGATATPVRTDKSPLLSVFDTVAFTLSIRDAIKNGCLTPFRAIGFALPLSLEGISEGKEGWDDAEVGKLLNTANVFELVLKHYNEVTPGRQAIAFWSSVDAAHGFAEYCRMQGIPALAADGMSSEPERWVAINKFKAGLIRILSNCNLYTEGVDLPMAEVLLQCRPTKSDLVYVQMAGRVLRLYPGKDIATILDFVPEDARDMKMAGDLLGTIREETKELVPKKPVLESFGILRSGQSFEADPSLVLSKILDYLGETKLPWTYDGALSTSSFNRDVTLCIVNMKSGDFGTYVVVKGRDVEKHPRFSTYEEALNAIVSYAEKRFHPDTIGRGDSSWRRASASDKQRSFMERLGAKVRDRMTAGEAAREITHYLTKSAIKKWAQMKG